jgi:glycosyltransferase involved in cell wall biosynthesis
MGHRSQVTELRGAKTLPQPIRLLYIIDFWASPGGTERHLAYLLDSLDPARFKCHVVIFNYQPNALVDQAKAAGIEVIHVPVARYYTPNAFFKAIRLFRLIRERKIDVVQTFHYKADVYGALVARLAGVRHIVSSKRDAADYKSAFHFFMHRLVKSITGRYIAVSEVVAEVIRRKEHVPDNRISVIYNGVDLDRYTVPDAATKAAAKVALGFSPDAYVIGMSAWFRPEKDHQLLIDAYLALSAHAPDARLAFVGGGPMLEHYKKWVTDRGLDDRIKFVGPVDDVRGTLRALDVACLVPRINEGFSNSVLEKMATGLPIIVTDVGGNKEAVVNFQNGYVIAPGARAELERLLLTLHRDPALRARLAAGSRARVESLFSLQQMINRHESLYYALAESSPGAAA